MSKYPDDLKTFTELWMNAYHPDSPLLFDSPAAATKFVKAARAIGFDETAFEQSRPTRSVGHLPASAGIALADATAKNAATIPAGQDADTAAHPDCRGT